MDNDFLASVKQEDEVQTESPVRTDEPAKETPTVPPADKKPEEAKPSQGGEHTPDANLPFHKHPRWVKTQEELAELRKYKTETQPRLETYEQMMARLSPKEENRPQSSIPEWFPKTGNQANDEAQYKQYLSYEAGVKAQIKQELLEDQTKEAKAKVAEEKKWTDWVTDSLQTLEDEGEKFDKNELQKTALEYLPSDENGNIDFRKALKIMRQLKAPQAIQREQQSDVRKRIADTAGAGSQRADSKPKQFQTQRSLRNKSWDNLVSETN